MRRLAHLSTTILAFTAAGCAADTTPPARAPDEPAPVTVVEPPAPPAAPRDLAVTAGVFAVALGDRPADAAIFARVDFPTDQRAKGCLEEARDAGHSSFVARLSADGRVTVVGPRSPQAVAGFDGCVLKLLEETPGLAQLGPAALRVDVRVQLASAPCTGPYCSGDPAFALGGLMGDSIGDPFGASGLGLKGTGQGGGGRGDNIGLGNIGAIGGAAGGAGATGQGFGSGGGRPSAGPSAKPPSVRVGATSVAGRLPPEVIQRIVRQNFGRFRLCYESALSSKPDLEGLVSVHFVINVDGSVSKVSSNPNTDIPDKAVVACVLKAFNGLTFPKPEGGIVTVTYPIKFSPGDDKPTVAVAATVNGKRLHQLSVSDVAAALGSKGWKTSTVAATDTPDAKTPFVVFAEKEDMVAYVTRQPGVTRKPHELMASGDGFTLVGGSIAPTPASGLGEIVQH